jgi:Smg protein
MQEKIIELIVYLMREIRERRDISKVDMSKLAERGYSQTEISTALSWIYDKMNLREPLKKVEGSRARSYRVFHEAERQIITKEARGFLIEMYELGLIDHIDMENIIERSLMSGVNVIGRDEIKSIAAAVIFEYNPPGKPGSRVMLNSSDTIN